MALYVEGLSKGVADRGMAQFQEMMRQQLESSMHTELEKLLDTSTGAERERCKQKKRVCKVNLACKEICICRKHLRCPQVKQVSMKDFEGFKTLYHRFLQVKGPSVEWIKIQRPPEDSIQPYEKISARGLPENVADCLNKLVHLNKTYNTDVPLVLMNSFNTDEDTKKILQKYTHHRVKIHTFNQSSQPNGKRCEFIMEVTDKTRADVKGGTLIQYDGKLRLLEIAQVPKAHVDEFKSVSKFKIFNTNNLWISLAAIKRLQEQKAMDLEIIVNPKVQEYLTRFESIPDMLELDHLTVSGDVTLGKNVSLKRNVELFYECLYRKQEGTEGQTVTGL
ncbi:UTP--glucose-1-phosphate uridylyltransferase [Collichthys lucidus]|uniref:UTP--glucose-1-phosphate uridylyltransferase n=1 Tax=Collichthys lucidus TaxID=240159 RepID=A0A4U5VDL1_COLLU|nr:UTP--glucose-1-phosphate uridylyltransferase [Collichthys lucidus]